MRLCLSAGWSVLPGEEAQVDYGQGAWVLQDGKRRRPHLLRVILSFSRKGYTEAFWQQSTENFIRGLENAFRHFGVVVSCSSVTGKKECYSTRSR